MVRNLPVGPRARGSSRANTPSERSNQRLFSHGGRQPGPQRPDHQAGRLGGRGPQPEEPTEDDHEHVHDEDEDDEDVDQLASDPTGENGLLESRKRRIGEVTAALHGSKAKRQYASLLQ